MQVEAATATLSAQGLLHLGRGNVRAVEIWGIEPAKSGKVTAFDKSLLENRKDPRPRPPNYKQLQIEGYVGIGVLASRMRRPMSMILTCGENDWAAVCSYDWFDSAVEGENGEQQFQAGKTIQFTIADVVFTGFYYFDSRFVYLPIEQLSRAIYPDSKEPVAGQIQIKLRRRGRRGAGDSGDSRGVENFRIGEAWLAGLPDTVNDDRDIEANAGTIRG